MSTEQSTDASPGSPRWLVVQATALLQSVATSNYACYGRGGVPRYPAGQPAPSAADPAALCAELLALDADDRVTLACLDLEFSSVEQGPQRVVWGAYDAARRLQVLWVWDFYRIQSHVALRLRLPGDHAPDAAWAAALDAVRALRPGETLALNVRSACGDIHQRHTLAGAAVEWSPPER